MFSRVLALLAVLLLSANTWAAIEINNHQARNMDDVQSLGVIYINHNFATSSITTALCTASWASFPQANGPC